MMDWQEKAEQAMAELQASYESPVYEKLLLWVECQYEAEKEALVVASVEDLPGRFMRVKALRDFKLMLLDRSMN